MPKKGYKQSEEYRKRASESKNKFYKNHPEIRKRISKSLKEFYKNHPEAIEHLRKINTGKNSHRWGTHHSPKTKKKMRESAGKGKDNHGYGKHFSKKTEYKKGKNHPMYGKKWSKKMSERMTGKNNSNYGKLHSEERKQKKSKDMKEFYKNHPESIKRISANQQGIPLNQWEKFVSFEPYTSDFNKRFKEAIRERDNHCCVVCNKPQEELKRLLDVHHIDYDKLNSFPQNCVSLCRNCHLKTNANRKAWTVFFQKLLKENYNYQYTQDQKIILDFIK